MVKTLMIEAAEFELSIFKDSFTDLVAGEAEVLIFIYPSIK